MYARGGGTNEEEALAEKRCVEVGAINAARDVAEWVYAQRFERTCWRQGASHELRRPGGPLSLAFTIHHENEVDVCESSRKGQVMAHASECTTRRLPALGSISCTLAAIRLSPFLDTDPRSLRQRVLDPSVPRLVPLATSPRGRVFPPRTPHS